MSRLEWRVYEAGHCLHPEVSTRRGASLRPCAFPALAFLLRHPRHGAVLFDTGYSGHFMRATARLPERLYRVLTPVRLQAREALAAQLQRDGIAPDAIGRVVLSHLHGDHVGGLADFPQARAACSRAAWSDLRRRSRLGALRVGLLPRLLDVHAAAMEWFEDLPAVALPAPFSAFGHGHDLFGDASLLLVPLPGHAAGHFGALFADADGPVFLVADAAWSSQAIGDNAPPPALASGWLGDTRACRATLARLHALHRAAPQVRLVPSHCRQWRPGSGACPGC